MAALLYVVRMCVLCRCATYDARSPKVGQPVSVTITFLLYEVRSALALHGGNTTIRTFYYEHGAYTHLHVQSGAEMNSRAWWCEEGYVRATLCTFKHIHTCTHIHIHTQTC